jgi:hypothetical protein
MDSNIFLLTWAFLATCGIGYFQAKFIAMRRECCAIKFALCEVASGDIKAKIEDGMYIITTEDIVFRFKRNKPNDN